jgi:4-hydroxy-tetrahydrodipicolinate synthase
MLNIEKKFVPVMITPFDAKSNIDYDTLAVLIDFYLAAGVKGLFANCLSSEMYSICESERIEMTDFIVKYVNGRVPVVATGSFGNTIEEKAEFTKEIYQTGIDAVILISSHFAKIDESDEVLMENFEKMLSLTDDIPLGVYECPAPYKRVLSADVFEKLVSTDRFVYHKDTSIKLENVKAKLDAIENNETMEFYDAHTPNSMYSINLGAKGMSSISGNFYPELLVWMCENATNPDKLEEVQWLQTQLNSVDPLIHVAYPMSSKYFLEKRGLPIQAISRVHTLELTPEQKIALDELYDKFMGWCEHLDIKPVTMEEVGELVVV